MGDSITIVRITATTALVYTSTEDAGLAMPFTIYASDGTTVVESVSVNDPRWGAIEPSCVGLTGLTPATTYIAKLTNEPNISTTFTTLADSPKVATESMWADLANRIKPLQPPLVISLSAPVTTAQNLTADVVSALQEAYESGRPVVVDARAQRVTPSEAIDDFAKGIFIVTKINRAGVMGYQLSLDTIAETSFNRFTRKSYFVSVSSSSPYGWSCNEVNSDSYRIVETNTGATWIDDKPIYRKTIDLGTLPNSALKTVAHGITNIGTIVQISGTAADGTNTIVLPASSPSQSGTVECYVSSTDVCVSTGGDRSGYSGYITLYYTKSS